MKKRIAVGVVASAAILTLAYIPGSPMEPGFEAPKKSAWGHTRVLKEIPAEDSPDYDRALRSMQAWCGNRGLPAEVWAERNSQGELEVLGRCTKTFRAGP